MYKRIIAVFIFLCFLFTTATLQIYRISTTTAYKELAEAQKKRSVVLSYGRGTVYDYKMNKLTNLSLQKSTYDFEGKQYSYSKLLRYSENQPASHIIGYIDSDGSGVSGIEKAFDDELSAYGEDVCLEYLVSAKGDVIKNADVEITGQNSKNSGGIVLTLDSEIQTICDTVLRQNGKSGAVVVLDSKSGAIRALSSYPTVDPYNVAISINSEEKPFLNRAFQGYNIGSLFKLAVSAAALECGISPYTEYDCTGSVDVDGQIFSCFNKTAHGSVNMESALCHSCNLYFIHLAGQIDEEKLIYYCKKFGISQPKYFANGIFSNGGNLPTVTQISQSYDNALFSFGQGKLLVTPIEAAEIINTIVNGGKRNPSYLVVGMADGNGNIYNETSKREPYNVLKKSTADLLKNFMVSVATNGTGKSGMPQNVWGGAKTATAETGTVKNGEEILRTWYGGFIGKENNAEYTIVVLIENGESGGNTAGPIFLKIAEQISALKGF